jgi:hypothetical protein
MSKEVESNNLTVLKERLADGEYSVDTKQVADAIIHRPGGVLTLVAYLGDPREQRAA